MADNVKPTYAKSDVKSGLENEAYAEKVLDGVPAKKDVDAINAQNTVHLLKGKVTPRS
jgi:5,10-methylene-tetrahydrofolate dehydrogenase/methenyl tetrahydrofolate cyclohydrolase